MQELFQSLPPYIQALFAGIVTWLLTALGAAFVFFFKNINDKVLSSMQGFAAGIMIAASFWSLLQPAIDFGNGSPFSFVPAAIGFLLGGLFIRSLDLVIPHMHRNTNDKSQVKEGMKSSLDKNILLVLAITLHNIPEGLSIGVAFGGVVTGNSHATLLGALTLAIGIGIQNIPEGAALSMPIRASGASKMRAFNYGQASAIVEPIFATIGALAVVFITPMLPYALAFAAGAMIFVVVEELIPDSQNGNNTDLATMSLMIGFTIMMILDVALG
ncbi:ZIP family metal transporter [Staphylococcus massiliensis]|uniref:Divalent heavy-metal cations transporter n=1 Tax=Staphylococcus massiliensis S46 TaxID=1229783 RepID=K9AMD9_9STAP|nr:ZIP family metal transporter [Staphylococcus massiliensis]EKU48548.1 divalent heavy-metal cations transporter [Staphylococcus massiliensis S46]MCG3400101.1 ZIP family metal transporter [Staphylococcus massiliensis]MCG3401823.1 ZIP family metal transporter [Staphylococcus massiliensis]MCG3413156.1 ZIP family metal transporter [Staphylococcus massiliensis]PNZ97561.1 ZIP family metal transporter [Staphylococcus massiliensis CCUG 55927]